MTMISFFTVSVNVLCFHVTYRKEIEKVLSAPPVGHCLLRFDALKKTSKYCCKGGSIVMTISVVKF